jgi:exopolysaccharide production protein ExoZ
LLNNVQILRAIAAYSVVVYHCLVRFLHPTGVGASFLDLGGGGVDLFFVISGFVMVHTTKDDESPAWFITKRIARIVPLYWSATVLVIAIASLRAWTFPTAVLTPDAITASLLFVPHVDTAGNLYPVLGVGWTLNYEMMFYALFAISLFLPKPMRLSGVIALITLVWTIATVAGGSVLTDFYGNPIVFEFAAGCVVAYVLRSPMAAALVRATPMWPVAGVAGVVLVVFTAVIPLGVPTVVRYGLPAIALVFAAAAQDLYRKPAAESLLTRLGDASYSAYLLHPIVIVGFAVVVGHFLGQTLAAEILILVLVPVATAVVSMASLKMLEKPSARLVRTLVEKAGVHPPSCDRARVLTPQRVR